MRATFFPYEATLRYRLLSKVIYIGVIEKTLTDALLPPLPPRITTQSYFVSIGVIVLDDEEKVI